MKLGAYPVPNADARAAVVRAAYAYNQPWSGIPFVEDAIDIARRPSYDTYRCAVFMPGCTGIVFVHAISGRVPVNSPAQLIANHRLMLSTLSP